MRVDEALRTYWGFTELRPLQGEVVDSAVAGRDAVVVLPTGGGKSLCFQMPPLLDSRLTVVVSPLLSLMKDQVDGLGMMGYAAAALNSHSSASEELKAIEGLRSGSVKLVYLSPERAMRPDTVALLRSADGGRGPARFAIDEAHCISNWGHDFRPEYRQLARLRSEFPDAAVHALTATAAPLVRDDIASQLGLRSPEFFIGRFDRPNLTYRVVPKTNRLRQIASAVSRHEGEASIVYCISRKDTESLAEGLRELGVSAVAYHAGLEGSERRRISEDFARERVHVVVATVAFGMGIDRSNVRCVVHESMPRSIESYQQETGRAGRDGLPSECLTLYAPSDVGRWERLIRDGENPAHVEHQIALLDEVRKFAVGTTCRHRFLSEYFGQEYPVEACGACDLCLEGWEATPDSTKIAHKVLATVMDLQKRHGDLFFGARHIASVLTGSRAKDVLRHGHDSLRGYGSLDLSIAKAQSFVDQLVDLTYLRRTSGGFPCVALTQVGLDALMSRSEVALRDIVADKPKRTSFTGPMRDRALYEALRSLRREIAEERGTGADKVLSDVALINVARQMPKSRAEFQSVSGVGSLWIEEFGGRFIEVVRKFAEPVRRGETDTGARLSVCFAQGLSVSDAAARVGKAESTVAKYLAEWIGRERPASVSAWVDDQTYRRVVPLLEEMGVSRLAPIFEALGGVVAYEDLHVVRAHWAAQNPLSVAAAG